MRPHFLDDDRESSRVAQRRASETWVLEVTHQLGEERVMLQAASTISENECSPTWDGMANTDWRAVDRACRASRADARGSTSRRRGGCGRPSAFRSGDRSRWYRYST